MSTVWTALTISDDMVLITDLKHITHQRDLVTKITEFQKIMVKGKDIDPESIDENPLMIGKSAPDENIKEYKRISANQRIESEF